MKVIFNKIIPFKGFKAVNLFGYLFIRDGVTVDYKLLLHESIHTAQMKELLYVPFYILYLLEWIKNLFAYRFNGRQAYRNISFEVEAYQHENEKDYLDTRKHFAQWRS